MKGSAKIIEALNSVLTKELTAINQYFLHARMLQNWGLEKIGKLEYEASIDEMKHADALVERILFLEGTPDLSKRDPLQVGTDVPSMLQNDLNVEYSVGALLKKTIALCESVQDYVTRDLLMTLLDDTENDHAHWLEQQLRLIKLIGLPNYIQSQI